MTAPEAPGRVPEHAARIETVEAIAGRARLAAEADGHPAEEHAAVIDRNQIRRALTAAFLVPNGDGTFAHTEDSWQEDIVRVQAVLDAIGGPL